MFSVLAIIGLLYEIINIIFTKWTIYLTGKILFYNTGLQPHEALYVVLGFLYMMLVVSWFFTGHVFYGLIVITLSFISTFLRKNITWIKIDSTICIFILFLFLYLG